MTLDAAARVEGLDGALRALKRVEKEGQRELRAGVQAITERHAAAVAAAGRSHPDPRVRHVATTVRAKKDRVPTITIGGAKKAPVRGRASATQLVYGTEWGAGAVSWWRFPPRKLRPWIIPTLSGRHAELVREWEAVVDRIVRKWAR